MICQNIIKHSPATSAAGSRSAASAAGPGPATSAARPVASARPAAAGGPASAAALLAAIGAAHAFVTLVLADPARPTAVAAHVVPATRAAGARRVGGRGRVRSRVGGRVGGRVWGGATATASSRKSGAVSRMSTASR